MKKFLFLVAFILSFGIGSLAQAGCYKICDNHSLNMNCRRVCPGNEPQGAYKTWKTGRCPKKWIEQCGSWCRDACDGHTAKILGNSPGNYSCKCSCYGC